MEQRPGLPLGMMFAARFGDEATLFRLAAQLEQDAALEATNCRQFAHKSTKLSRIRESEVCRAWRAGFAPPLSAQHAGD